MLATISILLKMANLVQESDELRKALIFCFPTKKSTEDLHRILVEAA